MRAGPTIAVVAMMSAVVLGGCATVGSDVAMDGPEWRPGYAWSFSHASERTGFERMDGETQPLDDNVTRWFVVEVFNTTISAEGEPLYHAIVASGDADDSYGQRVSVYRQRDLANVPFSFSSGMVCQNGNCADAGLTINEYYLDALTFVDFPVRTGQRWTDEQTEEIADGVVVGSAIEGVVQGGALVETGVGQIEAARIVRTERPIGIDDYRRMVMEEAESEGFDLAEYRVEYSRQEILYWSDDYQAIVRADVTEHYVEVARGTDPDGEPIDYEVRLDETSMQVLQGARLIAAPERPLADAWGYYTGELQIRDPAGEAVSAAEYVLDIAPGHAIMNAAAPDVEFVADIDGELGAGHSLHWRLRDAAGMAFAEADGYNFTPQPGRPGIFGVELESRDGGDVVAGAGATLVADWITADAFDCGEVSVVDLPACQALMVPIHAGVKTVEIRATPQVGQLGGNIMRLSDPSGMVIQSSAQNGQAVIRVEDFQFYTTNSQDWRLSYSPLANVMTEVPVDINIWYSNAGKGTGGESAPAWYARSGADSFL